MVLIGRSGSGKTTLLHLIAGISRPMQGTIRIDGVDITRLPEAGRDRFRADKIGYVFQTFNLLPAFTAMENVLLGMSFATGRREARSSAASVGARRPGTSIASQAGAAFGRRTTARGGCPGVGEQAEIAVGRRADGEYRYPASAAGDRSDPRNLPGRKRRLVLVTHTPDVAKQFERVENLEEINRLRRREFDAATK